MAALLVPLLVTAAFVPGSPVVVVPTWIVAACPVAPAGPGTPSALPGLPVLGVLLRQILPGISGLFHPIFLKLALFIPLLIAHFPLFPNVPASLQRYRRYLHHKSGSK